MGRELKIAVPHENLTVHIVDEDSRARAEQARTVLMLGYHAEVYTDLIELLERPPQNGVLMVRQPAEGTCLGELLESLWKRGIWAPVIVAASNPRSEQIVTAIQSGALDYLDLPLEPGRMARSLSRVIDEANRHAQAHRALIDARQRIGVLSGRERQVLGWLAQGCSNKMIARKLKISPRTVEIHRANMMVKLGARHVAEALRMWLQADLEDVERSKEVLADTCT